MFELELVHGIVDDKTGRDNNNTDKTNTSTERLTIFRKIIESLTEVAGEERINIKVSDKGLFIQVMDQMHVGLADVFLARELFPNYRCDRDLQLGLPAKQFSLVLKNIVASNKDCVKLYSDDTQQTLTVCHTIEDGEFTYNISLCELNVCNYSIPVQEYSCSVKIPSDKFRNATRLVGSFGEYIQMRCEKEMFVIKQKSEIMENSMKLINNDKSVCVNSTEPIALEIAMKYVNIINKICTLTDETIIHMSREAPVYFDFKLFEHLGFVKFYIAPKIDD